MNYRLTYTTSIIFGQKDIALLQIINNDKARAASTQFVSDLLKEASHKTKNTDENRKKS
jgi:hypothetical protein